MRTILLLLLLSSPKIGDQPRAEDLYHQGNAYYQQGLFSEAVEAYRQALTMADHPWLRFNLGNAYFKQGQLGRAVIQYRRARWDAPRDADISHNLEFVRNFRPDRIDRQPGPIESWLQRAFTFLSQSEAIFWAAVCFLLASLILSLSLITGRGQLMVLSLLPLSAWAYFLMVSLVWRAEKNSQPAVVVVKEASALSGPGVDFKEILMLHDGTEVKIRERRGDYLLVQLPGGVGGWVPQSAVERIY